MPGLISATGVLAFLADEEPELKVYALKTLNEDIDTVWTEVAGSLSDIEALYEDETFPERQLAALVLSKVYYHLQAYNDSMAFALAAGNLFKLDAPGEFEETIISKCIDQYIAVNSAEHVPKRSRVDTSLPLLADTFAPGIDGSSLVSPTTPFSQTMLPPRSLLSRASVDNSMIDLSFSSAGKISRHGSISQLPDRATRDALESVIERLFKNCLKQKKYRQVVGIAVEAKKLDVLQRVIKHAKKDGGADSGAAEELMDYALGICLDIVQEMSLRTEILHLILELLHDIPNPDYFAIAKCVVYLDADEEATTLLRKLIDEGDQASIADAYQISFDLYDNSTQEFLGKVLKALPTGEIKPKPEPTVAANGDEAEAAESEPLLAEGAQDEAPAEGEDLPESIAKVYRNIRSILTGSKTIQLNLEFLYRNNHTDLTILNKVRDSLEGRNSIFHTALTFCNAFMNQGTTNDKFFRDNLDWLGKAVNWSKFTATAALGVIHRGNLRQARKLLEPYLPRQGGSNGGSIFSRGGALYAYGLIHANHGAGALEYLKTQFVQAEEEVIQHGGALGLGIAGMATGSEEVFDSLKTVLFTDSALNGEAVGLAMGLIMLGTGNVSAIQTMLSYARDTTHEKIVRGIAIGMALIMFGRQEGADVMIEGLLSDPDPTLRYGGIMTVALAYCGTGSNKAVRKLLHVAVSDVSDDVRRIAVMSLGFILFRKPGSVPRMVELLSESYNPHVRYGSAMALGISCAGTGLDEAIDLLEPMMKDPTDFVRQGALIALSMILVQQNEVMNPKVGPIRKTLKKVVGDRHEDAMTKFGAALALGIIDAGGRNCTIGLQTQTGNLNMAGIVGMAVFTQYWYWFPFTHFLSLSFSPTSVIALDHDLEIPDVKLHCATRPSLFDYPPEQEAKAEEGPAVIATAILSTTAHAKRRAQKKERAMRRESMDLDQAPGPVKADAGDRMDVDEEKDKDAEVDKKEKSEEPRDEKKDEINGEKDATTASDTKKKVEKEKVGYEIENMSRVLPGQLKYISFPAGRYKPVKKPTGGPILLHDSQPEEPKTLVEEKLKKVTTERAPVAPAGGSGARGGRGGLGAGNTLLDALSRQGAGDLTINDLNRLFRPQGAGDEGAPATPGQESRGGAAAAAGVLTAVDEDAEGDEEATLPKEFEYFTDEE
ncbi:probable RPN2 - 26S proteasome regulatory subunit [Cephalotrichum gorgonifer]|uniref:26S proteasome regulatory subunit RPN2 n=1 Tax=Cephalotrichum gorgonifer TaxID=2041049 RepID=A0AAE8N4E6_9PEZI|nr:probable RPN2 - 26S proteasome regulatory subunit [Cephalotrichum gorgonifer]